MERPMNRATVITSMAILAIAAQSVLPGCRLFGGSDEGASENTTKAKMGPLVITSTESGELVSEKKTVISNELIWVVTIKSVKEEGELVKEGEVVIEFECKDLITAIEEKEVEIENAQMAVEQARKTQKMTTKSTQNTIVQAQNVLKTANENKARYAKESKSLVAKAREVVKKADEALSRYVNKGGKWENDLKDAETLIRMNEAALAIAEEKLKFKLKVNSDPTLESPYSKTELESDAMAVEQLKDALQKSIAAKELMIKYDHPNRKRQLEEDVTQANLDLSILLDYTIPQAMRLQDSAVIQAQLDLEKAQIGGEAELKWLEIENRGKEKVLAKQKEQLAELREEEEKLTVTAERDGLILYQTVYGEHGVMLQIKAGAKVNPRQKLIEIPDMTTLQVKTRVFESKNRHVKITDDELEGTETVITLDSLPNKEIKGHVTRRSTLPKINGQPWMKTGSRVYDLYVDVDWEAAGLVVGQQLKPGMKCNAEVTLEYVEEALLIPITAVYSRHDEYFCKKIVDGDAVEQAITLGKMNDRSVQVLSGLSAGDEVVTDVVVQSASGSESEREEGDE